MGGTGGRQGRRPKWAWGLGEPPPYKPQNLLHQASRRYPPPSPPKASRSFPVRQDPGGQEEPESLNHRAPMWQVPATGPHRCLNSTLVALALLSPPDWRNDKEF